MSESQSLPTHVTGECPSCGAHVRAIISPYYNLDGVAYACPECRKKNPRSHWQEDPP